jgi:ABC-2 type transport system permease protein
MLATVYRLTLRTQARIGRLAALGALGAVAVLVGLAIGVGDLDDTLEAGTRLVNTYGLSIYAPVVALVFGAAALGDPADDGTLGYLWLRPVRRSHIVVGAYGAALSVVLPLTLVPLVVAAALSGGGGALVRGTVLAATVAATAYTALFAYLGLRVRRSLVWGLTYILIWEGFVALAGDTAARLALRSYTRSVLADATGVRLRLADVSLPIAVGVPLVVAAVALALTTRRLHRMEVP